MSKKQACKRCKMLTETSECPNCKNNQLVPNWKGRISIIDAKQSEIAQKIGLTVDGEYAIKVT